MEYRPLGRTGVQVSKLCLGTMMFGAWGNTDHDDSIRIIHRALDAGINFVDTADVYSDGESEEIVGKALDRRPPRRRRPGDQVLGAHGRGPQPPRRFAAVDHPGGRALAATARHGLDRPLPDAPPRPGTDIDETLGALTDLVQQGKVRYIGSSSFSGGRSSRRSGWRASGTSSASAPSSRPTRCSCAASRSTSCPSPSGTAWASSPTARWPAAGCRAAGARTPRPRRRPGSGWPPGSTCRWPRTSEARSGPAARRGRRRRGGLAHRARDRLRRQPPGGDVRNHRTAHDGATR